MTTKLRISLFALSLFGVGGALYAGATLKSARAADAPAVKAPAAHAALIAPGHVEPVRDAVKLAFEGQGRIIEIAVDEGVAVKAGDVLARLDARMQEARVTEAEASVAAAAARHALAVRGPRSEDVAAARADAAAAAAAADHTATERDRSSALGATGALASSAVDADSAAARVASAQSAAATARYQSLAHGTRAEQVAEAAASLDAAKAELAAARVALDQMTLRAPADGVVLRRTAEVGQIVTTMAPAPVVTLADLRSLEVRAEVDEADIAQVAVGQQAFATVEAFGDRKFPVRVTRITHELGRRTVRDDDPRAKIDTRVLEVIAVFDTAPGVELPLGLRTAVHF